MIDAVEVTIRQPGQPDRALRLHEGDTRLGRAEDNEIVLPDAGVSRQHARIRYSPTEVLIEDLGSGNGTYYNGYRIQSQPLHHGDEVVIDPFLLRFHISGQVAPAYRGPTHPDGTQARLEVVVGTGMAGSSYPITSHGLSIGRSEEREVVIPDPAASRHHCQISLMGDDYVLQDMGSANGVYVNSVRVRDCTLADGDLIRIGNTEMRFVRYDQQAGDSTTQVVPHEVWHAGAGEPQIPATIQPRELPPPAPRKRSSGWIGLLIGGAVTLLAFFAVVLIGAVVLILVLAASQQESLPTITPTPPAWQLQLPHGLESASVDSLFQQGAQRFGEGDRRGALQDFYRVLQAKPSHPSADRFAFASGELLVLDVLKGEMERRAANQRSHEVTRDRLLRDARRPGRTGRNARAQLERDFRDDPVAIEAMSWSRTPEMQALDSKVQAAAEALANAEWVDANKLYHEILQRTDDPTIRKTALAGIKMSQMELIRPRAARWAEAVMTEATGEKTEAQKLFRDLAAEDPTNVSYRLHLQRLGR